MAVHGNSLVKDNCAELILEGTRKRALARMYLCVFCVIPICHLMCRKHEKRHVLLWILTEAGAVHVCTLMM